MIVCQCAMGASGPMRACIAFASLHSWGPFVSHIYFIVFIVITAVIMIIR